MYSIINLVLTHCVNDDASIDVSATFSVDLLKYLEYLIVYILNVFHILTKYSSIDSRLHYT